MGSKDAEVRVAFTNIVMKGVCTSSGLPLQMD